MVPQPIGGAERSRSKGNNRQESNPEADTGWKSRLSFSSKKKKEEAESGREETAAGASFRDFRKTKSKPGASESVPTQAALPAAVEPSAIHDLPARCPVDNAGDDAIKVPSNISTDVPDEVPRDITPEELDALSALASKLNPSTAETEFATELPTTAAAELSSGATEATTEIEMAGDATPVVERDAASADASACVVESQSEVEIPAQCAELAAVHTETHPYQEGHEPHAELIHAASQPPEIPVLMEVNTAPLAEEAAPVDRDDEPTFASNAIEQGAATNTNDQPVEASAASDQAANSHKVETSAPEEVSTAAATEPHPEESKSGERAQPLPENANQGEAEEMSPSDAELVEALRLLTPSASGSDLFSVPSPGMMAAAGQLLAEQARLDAAKGPRWIAEPMTLSPEEAALSLEAEMRQMLAATAATGGSETVDSGWVTGVSAIAAAVDNRLAEANLITAALSSVETTREPSENSSEAISAEASVPNPAEALTNETPEPVLATLSAANITVGSEAEAEHIPEEAPKAMAAAAAEGSSSSTATDASTIASIVDSVMADLRPRIVEEIARKLAKKD